VTRERPGRDAVSAADLDRHFPRYGSFDPAVPIWCVTPEHGGSIHRFVDSSPISPSGRYLGVTQVPYEDRVPTPGDQASVLVVDLKTGETHAVAQTRGWDTQLGAQVQWGADDSVLLFNDVDVGSWRPHGVKLNILTGEGRSLDGPIYSVSADGSRAASCCLTRIRRVQPGYGVLTEQSSIPSNHGASAEDGVYITGLDSGTTDLLVSFADIIEQARPQILVPPGADMYGFHVRWSPDGRRLQTVLCWLTGELPRHGALGRQLVTMRGDGTDIRLAIPMSAWNKGGNHPGWCPDSEHVLMNLKLDGRHVRFARARYDGRGLRALADEILGSGHPTMHRDGRYLLTDAHPDQPAASSDRSSALRLIDLECKQDRRLARIMCLPRTTGSLRELRVDPHPAWDRSFRWVTFNGCPEGTRRVYIADLGGVL